MQRHPQRPLRPGDEASSVPEAHTVRPVAKQCLHRIRRKASDQTRDVRIEMATRLGNSKNWPGSKRLGIAFVLALFFFFVQTQAASAQTYLATSLDSTLVPLPIHPVRAQSFIAPGDTLYVHVRNGPTDLLPFDGKITATIVTTRGDLETVYLFETDQDGVYTGSIHTKAPTQQPPVQANGTIEVRGNDTLTITCESFDPVTAVVVTDGTLELLTPQETPNSLNVPGQPLPEAAGELKLLTAGKPFLARVSDDDQNLDANVQDTVSVTIVSAAGDLETVTLQETTVDSGIFMGLVNTEYNLAPATQNTTLSVVAGQDSIVADYADPWNTRLVTILPAEARADVRGGIDGVVTLSPSTTLDPHTDLSVTVVDTDDSANIHSGPGNDTVMVTFTSFRTDGTTIIDQEAFEVSEDNTTAGTFTRAVPFGLLSGTAIRNDNLLEIAVGGSIRASYNDALQSTGQIDVPVAATPNPLTVVWSTTPPSVSLTSSDTCNVTYSTTVIEPGDTLRICVFDPNADSSPDTDYITVNVTANSGSTSSIVDLEQVKLLETGPRSGLFTGFIESKFAETPIQGNGMLEVRGRDAPTPQIRIGYSPASGAASVSADVSVHLYGTVRFVENGNSGASKVTMFRAGDSLFLLLADDDLNTVPSTVDTCSVSVTSYANSGLIDTENVTLTETGANTGVFVYLPSSSPFNGIPTRWVSGSGTDQNGVVEVNAGGTVSGSNRVEVTYSDAATPLQTVITRTDQVIVRKGADGQATVVDATTGTVPVTGGDRIRIRVTGQISARSDDGNVHDGPGNDTLTVTVTSYQDAAGTIVLDRERVVVSEDAAVEGTFQGFFPTRFLNGAASGTNDDGTLEVASGGSIQVAYTNWLALNGHPNVPVLSALASVEGNLPATVRFVGSEDPALTDPSIDSNIVRRIQPGDSVYIRVDDQEAQVVSNGLVNGITVSVTVMNPSGGVEDNEHVYLRETNVAGVFIGRIETIYGETINGADGRIGDGVLQVRGRDEIRVGYFEPSPAPGTFHTNLTDTPNPHDLVVDLLGEVRFLTNAGMTQIQGTGSYAQDGRLQALKIFNSIRADQVSVRAGDPIYLAVVDDDRNTSSSTADQVAVQISSTLAADTVTVTLTETGVDTGVFAITGNGITTQLVSGSGTTSDSLLQIRQSDTVRVDYADPDHPSPATGIQSPSSITVTDFMNVQAARDATITAVDQQTGGTGTCVRAGNNIFITVTEPTSGDPRFNPNVIDTVVVTMTSGTYVASQTPPEYDVETVQLFETGLDTRIFTGTIPTKYSMTGVFSNEILEIADSTAARQVISASYVDPQPEAPNPTGSNVRWVTASLSTCTASGDAGISIQAIQCVSSTEFVLGDTLRVSLSDPNLASMAVGSSVSVTLTAPSGDSETVHLRKNSSGDFDNSDSPLPTSYDQSIVHEDGLIEMVGGSIGSTRGEPLTATYPVPLDSQGRVGFPITATIRAFTRSTIRIAINRSLSSDGTSSGTDVEPQPRFGSETDLFTKDDTLTGFRAGDRIYIRVVDPDRASVTSTQTPATLTVTLTTKNLLNLSLPGDQEVVTLTEQPRVTGETVRGVFIGYINTAFTTSIPPSRTGILEVVGHDQVTATYIDSNTTAANTCLISQISTTTESKADGQILIVDSSTGTTAVSVVSLTPKTGETQAYLYVLVKEKDFDQGSTIDNGPVVTITTDAGDKETINTYETGALTGEFRGKIPLVYGRPSSGTTNILEVMPGDTITTCYTDDQNVTPGYSTARCATATVDKSSSGATLEVFVPRTGVYHPPNRLEEFIIPEKLKIRVRDSDQNTTAGKDALSVTIVTNNATKPDQETLILTETTVSSGVFEGEMTTAFPDNTNCPANSAVRYNNGILTLVGGDQITITYVDAHDDTGQSNVPIVATLLAAREYRTIVSCSNTAVDNSTIVLANGAKLTIPPGALHLKQDLTFQLKYYSQYRDEFNKVAPTPLNPGIQLVGDSGRVGFYEIRPSNLVFKKLVTFEIPISGTTTVLGDTASLSDTDRRRLKIFYFDGFDWQPSAGEFFQDSNGKEWIRAVSNHLTLFTLALDDRPPPSLVGPLLSQISLDKNPFTPNGDGINDNVIIQFGLGATATVTVKVLDANGDLVRTLLDRGTMQLGFNSLQWDGRYAFSTRTVRPGIYVIVVKAEATGSKDVQSVGVGVLK